MPLKYYAVIGNPIAHSLSPRIHQAFAQQCGINLQYEKICVETHGTIFEDFVREFFKQGGSGLNITLPFKERAFQLADQLTERARLAGAVNTFIPFAADSSLQASLGSLSCDIDYRILGDNTDGVGLIHDLLEKQQSIAGKRILILGSGGGTKGILPALLAENPMQITIASRGAALCSPSKWAAIKNCSYDDLQYPFDLIINATPLSLSKKLPPITSAILHANSFCYDLAYHASRKTVFTDWAKEQGVASSDGLGMLVAQAAEAFYQWHPKLNRSKINRTTILSFL